MESFDVLSVVIIALGLSGDCFAVAVSYSISLKRPSVGQALRLPLAFGIFQALMPVIGWLVGRTVIELIEGFDHWVAFALLLLVGGHMLWKAFRSEEEHEEEKDMARGFMLLTLSLATSIDALAVGLSFAFLRVNIGLASLTIGVVCFFVTLAGFLTGRKVGRLFGKRAEIVGGVILIGIGVRILLSHLLAG